ncbi:MAG: discoidin domain-containing protein [Armatimonadota bacterium]
MSRICLPVFVLLLSSMLWAQVLVGTATDLVPGSTATASGSAGPATAKYGPHDAIDDKPVTWWAANNKPPQWLEIKLPQPQKIDTITLENADNPTLYANMKQVSISFSDDSTVEQEFPDDRGGFIVSFPARTVSSFRITITATHDPAKTYLGLAQVSAFNDPEKQVRVKVSSTAGWKTPDLTEKGRSEHPCVYMTVADVAAARERVKTEPWAKAYAAGVINTANSALARPDEWYLKMRPAKGACFAYGFTGCPICKTSWGTWGGARCSWDKPGYVTCANGHVLPDAEHPDEGTGWKNPDGRIHYMVGSWNAWVVEQFQNWSGALAVAYSLTGDEKYAEKAGFILDAIADIYPSCDKGSWDYPSTPPSGRLCRPWYQVARVLVKLVEYYDQVYNSKSLDQPSMTEGLTRRENIERNMLKNGARYCYDQSLKGGLNNGEADYIRGALAVGCLLGIDKYVQWAYDGPYGILALTHNNVCRDGRYYETSVMYSDHSRELYLTFADPLYNYRSEQYPNGINVYDDNVFRSFYTLPASATSALGHCPRYGDSGPDVVRVQPPKRPADPLDAHFAEVLYARSEGQAKADFGKLLSYLSRGDVVKARGTTPGQDWLLFHAATPPKGEAQLPAWLDQQINATNFFGQKGLAILRTPNSPQAQAALIRFGPSLNHGHLDDLNLNYYALGYELTYDLGYGLGSTHTQVGWSNKTASHNLVMVDEKPQGTGGARDGSGGSLHLIAGLPGLQVADCSAEGTYQSLGVKDYRRLTALVGEGADSYLLDLFHVQGGSQHDYIFHALGTDVSFEGAKFDEPQAGSLAGTELKWGELQGNDADMTGYPGKPYWNPPPGNGLGFLMAPQRAQANGNFSATWDVGKEDCHLKMTLLPEPDTELITCWAPGIYPERQGAYGNTWGLPKARYVLARRKADTAALESTYAAVYEPYARALPEGVRTDVDLAQDATCTAGEIKPIPSVQVLLFKATGPEDEMRLPVKVAKTGSYAISGKVYGSPSYGQAQVALDGEAFEKLLNESNAVNGGVSGVFTLGTRKLEAGEHVFTIKVVKPANGSHWIGLQYLALSPEGAAAERPAAPFLKSMTRLPASGTETAVRVEHLSGQVDELRYNRLPRQDEALFSRVSTTGGKVNGFNLIGGSKLSAPGLEVRMNQGALAGALTKVDYAANRVYTTAKLPTDGRLNGSVIYFNNPWYSRNTAYRIAGITADANGSVIDLGRTSLVLGFANLDDDPQDEHTVTTLNPHEYSRALGGRADSGFFHGKLLATEDGKVQATIRSTWHAQPFIIKVDSAKGLRKGSKVYYYDVRQGDSFVIYNTCSLKAEADGTARLTGTADVTLSGAPVQMQTGGNWAPVKGAIPWKAEGSVIRLGSR